jgi:hypothetical protein
MYKSELKNGRDPERFTRVPNKPEQRPFPLGTARQAGELSHGHAARKVHIFTNRVSTEAALGFDIRCRPPNLKKRQMVAQT